MTKEKEEELLNRIQKLIKDREAWEKDGMHCPVCDKPMWKKDLLAHVLLTNDAEHRLIISHPDLFEIMNS